MSEIAGKTQDAGLKIRPEILHRRDKIAQTPILQRIANMKESLAAAGDEAQQLRHLPAWASREMADQGLYRFALPLELGGENLSAREQIEVVEAASAIDGSVGWCVQISSEINALVLRRMAFPLVEKIFNDWDVLVCSGHGPANGPNPGRNARRDGDGWRLNYQGSFASGCHNANWNYLMGPMVLDEATGEPARASYMVPRGEFEIVDTWDTAGTTGSRMDSPLERQLRDAQQAATHALISYRHYEDLGKTFVGYEPPDGYMELTRA